MANVVEFLKESYIEMVEKVSWPTWRELQNSAVIVIVASVIIAAIVWVMDTTLGYGLGSFYNSLN